MGSPGLTKSGHTYAYFDVVRVLGAHLVLVGHSLNFAFPEIFLVQSDGIFAARSGIFYMQSLGVVIFFALSGYLIAGSVLSKRRRTDYGFQTYLIERSARIFVPFVPAVLLVAAADALLIAGRPNKFASLALDPGTVLANLLMLYNNPVLAVVERVTGWPVDKTPVGSAAPFWSVVVEWWLYIAFGAAMLWLLSRRRGRMVGLAVFVFAALVPLATTLQYGGLVLAWLVGMGYAFGRGSMSRIRPVVHVIVVVLAAGCATIALVASRWDVYFFPVTIATAVVVLSGYFAVRDGVPGTRLITLLSNSSYSLYLVHYSVLVYLSVWLPFSGVGFLLVAIVLSSVVALMFWWCFERHYRWVQEFISRQTKRERSVLS